MKLSEQGYIDLEEYFRNVIYPAVVHRGCDTPFELTPKRKVIIDNLISELGVDLFGQISKAATFAKLSKEN